VRTVELANIGSRGFKIQAEPNVANLGTVVAAARDVNGDGKADLKEGYRLVHGKCKKTPK